MKIRHGKSKTATYFCWHNMRNRCYWAKSNSFRDYGARGITVCSRWRDFNNFLVDMGEQPKGMTIERIDNSKGYFKENCRWANRFEQGKNRTNNRLITFNGKTQHLSEWSRQLGIKNTTLWMRLFAYGWTVEEALCG